MPSALLFDLDGTLVDSRRDIAAALNFALVAVEREPLALEAVLPLVGDGARALVARALGSPSESLVDHALAIFQARYLEHPCDETTLLPGASEALAIDLPCAVVTNKPRAVTERVLAGLGIAPRFLWAGGDGPLKPAADGVIATAKALGVTLADAWLVGDGPQDILAGRAAGCVTVFVPGIADPATALAARPDVVLASLAELSAAVRGPRSP